MADNNLAVNIEVAVKNKTDLDLTASKIRNLQRDIKKLADEGNKDPLAIPKLKAANAELLKLNKTVVDLQKTMHRGKEEAEGLGESILHAAHGNRGINRLFREFGNLSGGIENTSVIFGRFVGGFAGGFAALAAFKGFEILRDQLAEASKRLGEFKEAGAQLGIKPIAAQAIEKVGKAVGEGGALAATQKLSDELDEARKRINAPGGTHGIEVLTGGMKQLGNEIQVVGDKAVKVFRQGGATGDIQNFATSLDAIARRFPGTEEGKLQAIIAGYRQSLALMSAMDAQQANIFSKERFGLPAESGRKIAAAEIARLTEEIEKQRKSASGATDDAISQNEKLLISQNALADSVTEWRDRIANLLTPAQIAFNNLFAEGLHNVPGDFQKVLAGWTHAFQSFWTEMTSIATAGVADVKAIIQTMADLGSSVRGAISSAASSVGSAASSATSALMSGADTGAPFARGGYVRGPGSGTSDSILARLSAGEFVVNSASVRRLGTSFLSGLNGYAAGGLVGIPRFAGGGLVSGGGTPVHLHLGGQSFALSGHANVVGALVAEAGRQQMRSAGVKPSWFGGRAGGH